MPARKGATPGAIRHMEGGDLPDSSRQFAKCPVCRSLLRFDVDRRFGQTIEACTNPSCILHTPHQPRPDTLEPPPMTPAERAERIHARRKARVTTQPEV